MAEKLTFDQFKEKIENTFMQHPVVVDNKYCQWFRDADLTKEEVAAFAVQFSVFSNLFLLACLNRVINAGNLESARETKEILMNELGVIYNNKKAAAPAAEMSDADKDRDGDPAVVSTEGSVQGGTFRFQAAHFEWLLKFGAPVGLTFDDMGKRKHGTKETLHFCDELFRLFGADDYNAAQGSSFAIENWAAAGFWKDLIAGLENFKANKCPEIPLAFFTWHDKIEEQHKEHVWDELQEMFEEPEFNQEEFIRAGMEMLDGTQVFWDGLMKQRNEIAAKAQA